MIMLDEDILLKNVCPKPVNRRGCLGLNKTDLCKVITLMVVVFISSNFLIIFLYSLLSLPYLLNLINRFI
jgi:hypothetical protein